MQLVWPANLSRARHGDGVPPAGAAFRSDQIVPTIPFVEVRRLGEPDRRSFKDVLLFADELAFLHRIFLQDNARKAIVTRAMVPKHVDEVFPAVVVMIERRIEAAAVHIDRIGPLAVDARAGHKIVVEIAQRRAARAAHGGAAIAFHIGVNEPEQAVRIAEARRPDAAGVGIALHI